MQLKIYIAGSLHAKSRIHVLAQALRNSGFRITSRWVDVNTGYDRDDDSLRSAAEEDVADLVRADVLIHAYTEIRSTGGGADSELGMALALRKPIVVFGDRSNIFHWLPQVGVVSKDLEELINSLENVRDQLEQDQTDVERELEGLDL